MIADFINRFVNLVLKVYKLHTRLINLINQRRRYLFLKLAAETKGGTEAPNRSKPWLSPTLLFCLVDPVTVGHIISDDFVT